eukprot:CAMPEP_0167779540 /NCGR_PEP_ID=MMETSP0111_2-20121227/4859_1 /TAXON_ID=91324 /ORGANISM="Lotharella globosa, Strain CCCM811" /LENGTH=152 /DNA_ID=CAMNT_0007669953 /DNA_START=18 /DNA_END=477 /DNA_ORIENTATION=+
MRVREALLRLRQASNWRILDHVERNEAVWICLLSYVKVLLEQPEGSSQEPFCLGQITGSLEVAVGSDSHVALVALLHEVPSRAWGRLCRQRRVMGSDLIAHRLVLFSWECTVNVVPQNPFPGRSDEMVVLSPRVKDDEPPLVALVGRLRRFL